MIAYLNGTIAKKGLSEVIVEVGGIGYLVNMSDISISNLPDIGNEALVRTYLQVSDQGAALFGFLDEQEEFMFKKLIGVSGIGPKIAMAALSTFKPEDLANAIKLQDVGVVSKIPGVGKKSAERIIVELKDSFGESSDLKLGSKKAKDEEDSTISVVKQALLGMGFSSSECDQALRKASGDLDESGLLEFALKNMG